MFKLFWFPYLKPDRLLQLVCKNRGEITLYVLLLINTTLVSVFTAFVFRGGLCLIQIFFQSCHKKIQL